MCGAAGYLSKEDYDFVKTLAYFNGLRGMDGTGIVQGVQSRKKKKITSYKTVDNIAEVLQDVNIGWKEVPQNLFKPMGDNFIFVHTRAATRGKITTENCHPFEFDKIVGMHNGTLYDKKFEHEEKTDSELLFKEINSEGVEPVLASLEERSKYAIVMFDKTTGDITIARDGRPLYVAYNLKRRIIYWASEAWMLDIAEKRSSSIELGQVYAFKEKHIHTFSPLFDIEMSKLPSWTLKRVGKEPEIAPVGLKGEIIPPLRIKPSGPSVPIFRAERTGSPKEKQQRFSEICLTCGEEISLVDKHLLQKRGKIVGGQEGRCVSCIELDDEVLSINKKTDRRSLM